MTSRKSVSLNKAIRGDMLHSFFCDISRQPRIVLEKVESNCAQDIYDMIYGEFQAGLANVPDSMLRLEETMPLPCVVVKQKKAKRKKGSIESTITETFQFRTFRTDVDIDRSAATTRCLELDLGQKLPQASSAQRWSSSHLDHLQRLGLVDKAMLKKIEARYIKACKEGEKILKPVIEAMDGVAEILTAVKTTKGLLAAWPGCEKYLILPPTTQGVLVKVDIKVLDANLSSLYPPAEKTSLSKAL